MNDASAHGDGNRLRAVIGTEFSHDVLDVNLDSPFRDAELVGNIPVAISFGDLLQDLDLTSGQRLIGEVIGELGRYFGGIAFLPA